MRNVTLAALSALCIGGVGCQQDTGVSYTDRDKSDANRWLVDSYFERQAEAGALREHTFYPHHFEEGSNAMNSLGRRRLSILAKHYHEHGGRLNIHRGDAGEDLYAARVNRVVQELNQAGVDTHRVTIGDEASGGDGMVSGHVQVVLAEMLEIDDPGASSN
ncbi:MAG: hypothetical protein CMJ18_27690 [Phycisphaeraceae bacterium]|nr:hypothetical protein [Phycisphaeraceae bacterium]